MNKTCTKCKQELPIELFSFRNKKLGKRTCWCKPCYAIYDANNWSSTPKRRQANQKRNNSRKLRNAQFVWDYLKTNPCSCGENDPVVLEFDHRNPAEKFKNISDMLRCAFSIETIKGEIQKCDVLCANCHRRKTAEQFGWYSQICK